jgi:AMP phosphorylase
MEFIPKKIPIRAGHKYIVVLNKNNANQYDLHPGDRLKAKNKRNGKELTVMVDITDNGELSGNKIGVFAETYEILEVERGDRIKLSIMERPLSIDYIKAKMDGATLNEAQLDEIVKDIIEDDLSDTEMTYFVSASYLNKLSDKEAAYLTKAIVKHGKTIKFAKDKVMDKHCIGGVPGNRTTMIIIPIIAAAGLTMPKTSSRAITSPSGTADTMEVLANVTIQAPELKKIAKKTGAFIAWGGGVDIASADDQLIRVRHPLSLDPEGMLLASIMAKKFAVGSTHVLIYIPYGKQVKVKTKDRAAKLKKRFEKIGKYLGMQVKVILTKGEEPIGQGIGPVLEAIDVMKVLKNEKDAPKDLIEKSLEMAGILLEMGGAAKRNKGYKMAKLILESGKALKKMEEIIKLQGPPNESIKLGKYKLEFASKKTGRVIQINNKLVSKIARIAGAPLDKQAGIYIHKKIGDNVKKGETLYTVYADSKTRIDQVKEVKIKNPYKIN